MAQAQADDKKESATTKSDEFLDKMVVVIEKSVARNITKEQIIAFLAKKDMTAADIDKAFEKYYDKNVCNI